MRFGQIRTVCIVVITLFLSGCSFLGWQRTPVLATPEQVTYEEEVQLAQISQQLARRDLDNDSKIQLLYQRGARYDALGFQAFAQSDFTQILNIRADIPEIYNYLGNYAVQQGDLDSAYLALNTALELNPDYEFAKFNRAIALYRGERYQQAREDALQFYQYSPNEPFRILWLYLIEREIDSKQAKNALQQRYNLIEDKSVWGSDVIAFYLGSVSESELMSNVQQDVTSNRQLAERLCEMYFYLGKYYLNKGDEKRAELLFKYVLSNNIYNYIEHQQALLELAFLETSKAEIDN